MTSDSTAVQMASDPPMSTYRAVSSSTLSTCSHSESELSEDEEDDEEELEEDDELLELPELVSSGSWDLLARFA